MNLLLVDVDGALVNAREMDMMCFQQAVEAVLHITLDKSRYQERVVTDSAMLDEILYQYPVLSSRSIVHRQVEQKYLENLTARLHAVPQEFVLSKGAREFLEQMAVRDDTHVAITSGGWAAVSRLKLKAAGIDASRMTFASSSDAASRTEIMALAAFRAKQDTGMTFKRRIVFAEGEWNQRASQELGYEFVAVGKKLSHHTYIPSLSFYQAVLPKFDIN
ncbi:haloacid dehalogenase-like hydrolase [Photobacterium sp. WH77]|uniref:Haloacid dehalogenase-like hydrolase n=1 Tax=Photobacterium arenosum TaxID=2774143 RepID=A0ABR9BN91_9GAMM|nr:MULTISPECIES: haloacid dehalogenase-like hydrolase [Photobacterium]MBD8514036.1 haloacid dehalogenase-like hydrolase [Photobacterium arenosum]MBV7263352.1 haloacid dehalogenase-like hydrolase [Photobacterium sp. WH24]MCG2837425.1 haloacid dehalogenase-like hydrolase [Photobacterium sp. WH77]MCG2845005.1 haloacid dehalogenase-like hydrolase [Photobacterium sp. WH80]MDO6582332.1 haloacid dehalogenase-like hydrolase [Photobacterium sp. 2_MG-2023]